MFKAGNDTKLYHDALTIRKEVFIEEQGVPKDLEIDQYEQTCQYIVAYNNHTPIATARYREVDGCVKVERVAVVRSARRSSFNGSFRKRCTFKRVSLLQTRCSSSGNSVL